MRKFLYMLAALLVLIGISTNDVEARQDVYATTYLGNNWYVDQDSVKRVGDILNFTVYTTAGLSYKVTSSDDNYYNADVFYDNNKLVSDNGQSVWKSPMPMLMPSGNSEPRACTFVRWWFRSSYPGLYL